MITLDPEDVRLSKREREFLRRIALKLQADAQRRWHELPSGHQAVITEFSAWSRLSSGLFHGLIGTTRQIDVHLAAPVLPPPRSLS